MPDPAIADADSATVDTLRAAVSNLTALRSYRFSVDIAGRDVVRLEPSSVDFALRGTVTHSNGLAMDALVGTTMREMNGTGAAVSFTQRVVLGGGHVWTLDKASGTLQLSPDEALTVSVAAWTPDGLATRFIEPFAGGFRRVGNETHGGVKTVHYRASAPGVAAYASALRFGGDLTADLWIAAAGGYLAGARIAGTGSGKEPSTGAVFEDSLLFAFEATDPDSAANVVELPTLPASDPARPSGPPVDLELEYRVMPSNGTAPTAQDVYEITVMMRQRLDISHRPVSVDTIQGDRIVITVCGTTHVGDDRRAIEATSALTVVGLPTSEYGSSATPGPKALPLIGGPIDPALEPIYPADRVGLSRQYVDPVSGRRGATFLPENKAADTFRQYATAHPGEYVAVVLDGTVLATMPIVGEVADGWLTITGDYSEAEARRLAASLYIAPLRFPLEKVRDEEVPTP